MIVRRCLLTLTLSMSLLHLGSSEGERWSRQVANSEWIPLANPRAVENQLSQVNQVPSNMMGLIPAGGPNFSQLQPLTLPPALQQQYQQQLVQLQKTQESIQKLLLLQQQLRAQQQLLQAQTYLPNGYNDPQDEKQALHQSTIANLQSLPELAPDILLPPVPVPNAQPPVFPAQEFLSLPNPSLRPQQERLTRTQQQAEKNHQTQDNVENTQRNQPSDRDQAEFNNQQSRSEDDILREQEGVGRSKDYTSRQGGHYKNSKQSREYKNQERFVAQGTTPRSGQANDEEEVQLLYVPAETLAQRGQQQHQGGRNRKFYLQQEEEKNSAQKSSTPSPVQQAYAQQVLQHFQLEQEERERLQREEREKEIARLKEEQKELDRQAQLRQELIQREEELTKQRELEKIRKQDEARQAEIDRLAALEHQKELEIQQALEQQKDLERQQAEEEARAKIQLEAQRQTQAQAQMAAHRLTLENQVHAELEKHAKAEALIRGQQQHLTETTRPRNHRLRSRQRQRVNQNQKNPAAATPSPNQPPLSVYMGSISPASNPQDLKVSDVLAILKDAKSISVLDSVKPDAPQVFVGPTNLDPPVGYAKFDLPYLSSIDNNRVERRVDKLPFFVAPMSFVPPPGYSKIPFPAPHIGSVVVNNMDNLVEPEAVPPNNVDPSPTPLIEPNSYIENRHSSTISYEPLTTPAYSQEVSYSTTTTPKSIESSPETRYRHRQFFNANKASSPASYRDNPSSTQQGQLQNESVSQSPSTANYQSSSVVTTPNYQETSEVKYENQVSTTGNYQGIHGLDNAQVEPTREQDLAAQLALINQELTQHREVVHRYNSPGHQQQETLRNPFHEVDHASVLAKLAANEESADPQKWRIASQQNHQSIYRLPVRSEESVDEDTRAAVGPTQYSLPAELPPISPNLPGLVNSLLDGNEPTVTTTTTTESAPITTTHRSRGRHRGRLVVTRPTTTTVPPQTINDRPRRPYSRTRSRYTTTEDYAETVYEPTKAKLAETTQRVDSSTTDYNNQEHTQRRKPSSRSQRFRSRGGDKNAVQSETHPRVHHEHSNYNENPPSRQSHLQPVGPAFNPNNVHQQENYPPSTTQNYPSSESFQLLHDRTTEASSSANNADFPKEIQDIQFHSGYGQADVQQAAPENRFNYQEQTNEDPYNRNTQGSLSSTTATPPEYNLNQSDKIENVNYNVPISTEQPDTRFTHRQHAEIYNDQTLKAQPNYISENSNGQNHFAISKNHQTDASDHREGQDHVLLQPVYDHVSLNKHEEYHQVPSTEAPQETTIQPTTTIAPVIIRQKVRARLGGQNPHRVHQDSVIQTRPRGSQEEYVRFQASNQDSVHPASPGRPQYNLRTRPRIRTQPNNSQVQTDGNDYVRIQAPNQYHRPSSTTTTSTTTQAPKIYEQNANNDNNEGNGEDIEYGFIRPPSFQPIHPVDTEYQAAVTHNRPAAQSQVQAATDDASTMDVTATHAQILRNRQKYHVMNRRPLTKPATPSPVPTTQNLPSPTTIPDEKLYTVRPKSRPEGMRIRGRVRRPGKRRGTSTTTTTESALDSSNELPLDENYPQIIQGSPLANEQRPLYQESLRNTPQQNYQGQEFVINFGAGPSQDNLAHEEYDQTQLASTPPRKYSQPVHRPVDIEGAESQWSTKLTVSSFQPSYSPNQLNPEVKTVRENGGQEKNEDTPEIITAGPELPSMDILVTSDDKRAKKNDEPIVSTTDQIKSMNEYETRSADSTEAKKTDSTNAFVEHEKANGQNLTRESAEEHSNGLIENAETTVATETQEPLGSNFETTSDIQTTTSVADETFGDGGSTNSESTESIETTEPMKAIKKAADRLAVRKTGHRRRRVRIRARPVDDIVTAESQHIGAAVNTLFHDKPTYSQFNQVQDLGTTTNAPEPSTSAKSLLEDFLEEMLKNSDEGSYGTVPTTTDLPSDFWTTTTHTFAAKDESTVKEVVFTTENDSYTTTEIPTTLNHQRITEGDKTVAAEDVEATTKRYEFIPRYQNSNTDFFNFFKSSKDDEREESSSGNQGDYPKNHKLKFETVKTSLGDVPFFEYSKYSKWNHKNWTENAKNTTIRLETAPEVKTTVASDDNDSSAEVQVLSDYVKDIFRSIREPQNYENATKKTTVGSDEAKNTLGNEEGNEAVAKVSQNATEMPDANDSKLVDETEEGKAKLEDEKDLLKDEEKFQYDVVTTTSARSSTIAEEASSVLTTQEVPVSPDELTTEIPTTETVPSFNSTDGPIGRILRTSTTTEVSHMTEICYRGRCVKTRPKSELHMRNR